MYSIPFGISYTLHRLRTPSFFIPGEAARHIVLSPRDGSATISFASKGSSPRSTHSTEAKNDFKSKHMYIRSFAMLPPP